MFCHKPNKEQQNWTVEDAVAHKGGATQEMKFQCPSDGNIINNNIATYPKISFHFFSPPPPPQCFGSGSGSESGFRGLLNPGA